MKTRRLTKEQLKNKRMGQIAMEDYRTVEIFVSHGLDYCCQGDKTVGEACNERGIEGETVLDELVRIYRLPPEQQEIGMEPDPGFQMGYIINRQHQMLFKRIGRIKKQVQARLNEITGLNPAFFEITRKFIDLCDEMESHMRLEEQEVFPFLADLLDRGRNKNIDSAEQIKERIAGLRSDHNHIGKLFDEIRQLNNRLIPPEIFDTFSACEVIAGSEGQNIPDEVCSFYRVISVNFEEVERVIRDSVHLENNLFIPNIGRYLQMN